MAFRSLRLLHSVTKSADSPPSTSVAPKLKSSAQTLASENAEDFQALALPHLDALYRTALRMAGQAASAEDLVQETYLRAYRNFDRFQAGTNFKAWIFTILTNIHINDFHRKAMGPSLSDFSKTEPAGPEEVVHLSVEEVEALKDHVGDEAKRALEAMPAEYRIVFLLATLEEMSYKEIAATQNIPIGTVMSRLARARCFLRKELTTYARNARLLPTRTRP